MGPGTLILGPSRGPCWGSGAILERKAEYSGYRLLVPTASSPATLAPSGAGRPGMPFDPCLPP